MHDICVLVLEQKETNNWANKGEVTTQGRHRGVVSIVEQQQMDFCATPRQNRHDHKMCATLRLRTNVKGFHQISKISHEDHRRDKTGEACAGSVP